MSTKEKKLRKSYVESYVESYVSEYVSFGNSTNVKFAVTQITQTPNEYWELLNNIRGDVFKNDGVRFNKLVLHSLNYLFTNCINSSDLVDTDWSLEFAKSILDKNNDTGWSPIASSAQSSNISVYKKDYYKECFAFIQLAYYLNSIDLTQNQYFIYIDNYLTTGTKLPEVDYKLDLAYLNKKYSDYDKKVSDHKTTAKTTIKNHFFGCLFILCNDLGLSVKNFKVTSKKGRDYNPMVKVPREFRKYFPFLLNEHDIKAAYPHFIDLQIDSNCANGIYEKFAESLNLSRDEAKQLFNKTLNSRKYHSRDYFVKFFEPIYKDKTEAIVNLVMDSVRPFWMVMQNWELLAIDNFKTTNKIKNVTRLHDAIISIDNIYSKELRMVFLDYSFGFKRLNSFSGELNFEISKKRCKYNYVSSLPPLFKNNYKIESDNRNENKENILFKSTDFNIYKDNFSYIKAGFNIANKGKMVGDEFIYITADEFTGKIVNSIAVLVDLNPFINQNNISNTINEIVSYIFDFGVYSFNKDYLVKYLINHFASNKIAPIVKERNWIFKGNSERNNLTMYEWSSLMFSAQADANKYFYSLAIIEVVKHSYHNEVKKYIRLSDLGITDKRKCDFISDIVSRFNAANGIGNLTFANSINEMCTKMGTLHSTPFSRVTDRVHNLTQSIISIDFNINRRTAKKIKDWNNQPQNLEQINDILQELEKKIKAQEETKEFQPDVTPLPLMSWNDAFNIEVDKTIITKVDGAEVVKVVQAMEPTPKVYFKSVLNCDYIAAAKREDSFLIDWYLFRNQHISDSERDLIKSNQIKAINYIKEQRQKGLSPRFDIKVYYSIKTNITPFARGKKYLELKRVG